jgi:serine/threonine-protein kinase RsbW
MPPELTELAPGFSIRRFRPEDSPGIVNCVRRVYGDSYIHRELYEPDQIIRQNQSGETISVVALDSDGLVVGHYALERPELGRIAEEGEAIVLPEYRHHHLMEGMRELLEAEAHQLGLTGLYGWAVTNHLYSQKVHARFGLLPCAIALGSLPRSFHNMPEPLPQRLSLLLGFKYLRPPAAIVAHVPARHRPICARIYEHLQLTVDFRDGVPAIEKGSLSVETMPKLGTATIRVERIGPNMADEVRRAYLEASQHANAVATFLELPLNDPGTPALSDSAEAAGFFFNGIGPSFAKRGDVLHLQCLTESLDTSLIQLENPFARQLLGYIDQERRQLKTLSS